MLWKTHIRIANEVLRKLGIPKSSIEADRLREGSVTPDKWKDYPHHYGKSGSIREHILEARKFFLRGDLSKAYFDLGVVLHYIQDFYTSLSTLSDYQRRWEQQIEQAYFVEDLEELVRSVFRDREDRIEEYIEMIRLLSEEIEGKEDTLRLATLPGPGQPFWGVCIGGRPDVDLNFALRASLIITQSVLGSRTSPKLKAQLRHLLREHEAKLRDTETIFANEIVELIKKRDELKKRRRKDGIFPTLQSYFLTLLSKIHNLRAQSKMKKYEQQKHLERVARAYPLRVQELIAPHRDWYNITIPQIDINIIEKELLLIQEASASLGISETITQDLVKKGEIACYYVKNKELIRKSELRKVLRLKK